MKRGEIRQSQEGNKVLYSARIDGLPHIWFIRAFQNSLFCFMFFLLFHLMFPVVYCKSDIDIHFASRIDVKQAKMTRMKGNIKFIKTSPINENIKRKFSSFKLFFLLVIQHLSIDVVQIMCSLNNQYIQSKPKFKLSKITVIYLLCAP